jgi:hypothetical protein
MQHGSLTTKSRLEGPDVWQFRWSEKGPNLASARANRTSLQTLTHFFLLKSRHGYVETDNKSAKLNVDIALNPVMIVRDHGGDATWAAKAEEQQRRLIADNDHSPRLEASTAPQIDAVASFAPAAIPAPIYEPVPVPVPVAPSWAAPVQRPAPLRAAPYYGPPVFESQSQPAPAPIHAPEPIRIAFVEPVAAPVWRNRA